MTGHIDVESIVNLQDEDDKIIEAACAEYLASKFVDSVQHMFFDWELMKKENIIDQKLKGLAVDIQVFDES